MLNKNENFMFSPGDGGVSWFILFFGGFFSFAFELLAKILILRHLILC